MKKYVCLPIFFILLLSALGLLVYATGFETEGVSPDERKRVENRITYSQYNHKKVPFSQFDVNEAGMVALVSESSGVDPIVRVYDRNGTFQYRYRVDTDGSIYAEWEGDHLWIYIVRGDHAVLVDDKGTVMRVETILDTRENTSHWYEVWEKEKTVDNETYVAKTGLGILGVVVNEYSQLVVTDGNGEADALYDVRGTLLKKALLRIPLIALLIFVGISVIVLAVKSGIRYQNRIRYGSSYKPGAKRTFYDRILDALEKRQVASEPNEDHHS